MKITSFFVQKNPSPIFLIRTILGQTLLILREKIINHCLWNAEFISIDCGGTRSNYTDTTTGITWISDSEIMKHGEKVEVKNPNGNQVQYQKRRDFPTDSRKKKLKTAGLNLYSISFHSPEYDVDHLC